MMKVHVYSQWQGRIAIPARVRQFTRAAKLSGRENFKEYAGILNAPSERKALEEWLDNMTTLRATYHVA